MNGIYLIVNLINNKYYVGSSAYINDRISGHKSDLRANKHSNGRMQNAWNKYGEKSFKFYIIEITHNLIKREQYWIDKLQAADRNFGYNIRKIAESNKGIKFSQEYKDKMSQRTLGRTFSEEHRKNHKAAQIGKKLSNETKEKLRTAKRNASDWPHKNGNKCQCDECKLRLRIQKRNAERIRKHGYQIIEASA